MTEHPMTRRDFVAASASGTAAVMLSPQLTTRGQTLPMPERPLGRTGHRVRLFSLGGQATLERPGMRDEAVTIINRAIDLGVNYIDTAAAYGRGISQSYIGEVMATRRREVFLATKTHDRTRDGSLRLLEESLRLLRTDRIDLWQLHNVRTVEQIDRIFAPGGALEAMTSVRDEGTVRFLGITGHYDPAPLMEGVRRFAFDTVLMALNAADPHIAGFGTTILPLAIENGMGVIGMKIPARGRLFRSGGITSMREAMRYVLTLPVSTVIVGCDTVDHLEENVAIARAFEPLSADAMRGLEARTASYAADALFFRKGGGGWER